MSWKARLFLLATVALLIVLGLAPRSAFSPGSVPASALGGGTPNCVPYFNASGILVCTNSPTYSPSSGLAVPDTGDGNRGIAVTANSSACPEPVAGALQICAVGSPGAEVPQLRSNAGLTKNFATLATGFAVEGAVRQLGSDQHIFSDFGALIGPDDGFYVGSTSDLTKRLAWNLSGMTTGKTITLAGVGAVDSTVTLPPITSYALATTRATHLGIAAWGDGDNTTADTGDMVCAALPGAGACVTVCPETAGVPTCGTSCSAAQAVRFLAYCK